MPDFSNRSWKDIIALHDHDGAGAFREKVVEIEQHASGLTGPARAKAIHEAGLFEIAEALRKRSRTMKGAALDIAVDLVASPLGPFAPIATAVPAVLQALRQASEWTAVYLELVTRPAVNSASE